MADDPDISIADEKAGEPTAAEAEQGDDGNDVAEEIDAAEAEDAAEKGEAEDAAEKGEAEDGDDGESQSKGRLTRWRELAHRRRFSHVGSALVASALIVATLAGLSGWLGYRAYQKHDAQARRDLFIQTARQGAVNLTTINYTEVDADVQRILEVATGAFREDFEQRSKPFIEVVKAAQSKSEGTVTDAGVESQHGDSAQVLVAVAVKSQTADGAEAPREWRMRIEVRSVGDDAKVSNVVFVP